MAAKGLIGKKDILIPVMGSTGAGKSYFINAILKENKMKVGTQLDVCTSDLGFGYIKDLEKRGYPALAGHRIVLIDTPGFEETYKGDRKILEKIVTCIKESSKNGAKLGGIIYLHDISLDRFNNTGRENLRSFEHLCGDDALKNVVLGTTKWCRNKELLNRAEERQVQLETGYWQSLIVKGSHVRRFDGSDESAWAFIEAIFTPKRNESLLRPGTEFPVAPEKSSKIEQNFLFTATDILIPVMGLTGAGKSYFINTLLKAEKMAVGTDLHSCTNDLSFGCMDEIKEHPFLKDRRIVLVDTPGFDDTFEGDSEPLEKIAAWLKQSCTNGAKLGGVIYLHDISIDRINRAAWRNIKLFENLCGDDALKNVVLGTTKWCRNPEHAEIRQVQLETKYWEPLIKKGLRVHRFDNSYESAWALIEMIISPKPTEIVLQIQREMVEFGKASSQTSAGKYAGHRTARKIHDYLLNSFDGFFQKIPWFFQGKPTPHPAPLSVSQPRPRFLS